MIKLDENLLVEIGLGSLPKEEKTAFLKHMYETLEMRVGTRLAERMSDQQMSEFEQFITTNDEQGAFHWLESNFPNYKDVVAEEFEKLKGEVRPMAAQIVSASQAQAAQNAQNNPQNQGALGGQPGQPGQQPQQQPNQQYQPNQFSQQNDQNNPNNQGQPFSPYQNGPQNEPQLSSQQPMMAPAYNPPASPMQQPAPFSQPPTPGAPTFGARTASPQPAQFGAPDPMSPAGTPPQQPAQPAAYGAPVPFNPAGPAPAYPTPPTAPSVSPQPGQQTNHDNSGNSYAQPQYGPQPPAFAPSSDVSGPMPVYHPSDQPSGQPNGMSPQPSHGDDRDNDVVDNNGNAGSTGSAGDAGSLHIDNRSDNHSDDHDNHQRQYPTPPPLPPQHHDQ
jgi:hypothetical protein